jgi:hypothetical protein
LNSAKSGGYAGVGIWAYQYPGSPDFHSMINTNGSWRAVCFTIQNWNYNGTVWVDFSAPGPGSGTQSNPYNTLALGSANVPAGGTVVVKGPNSTTTTTTISKPMIITASGGAVSVGH